MNEKQLPSTVAGRIKNKHIVQQERKSCICTPASHRSLCSQPIYILMLLGLRLRKARRVHKDRDAGKKEPSAG